MAGISKQERLDRARAQATEKIRERLPEIADQLIDAGLGGKKPVGCPKCKHKFEITLSGDPKLLLELWARVEGKPTEQKQQSEIQPFLELVRELNAMRGAPALPSPIQIYEVDTE